MPYASSNSAPSLLVSHLCVMSIISRCDFPYIPWRDTSSRWLSTTEVCEQPVCLVQDIPLLLDAHINRILMRVTMEADLVPRIADHGAFFRKSLETVPRNKPCSLDAVFLEELQ